MNIPNWMKTAGVVLLAAATLVALSGAAYERQARANAKRQFPVPGKLVTFAPGRQMQIDCRGVGSPVVVLEAGLGTYGSLSWAAVHDSIATTTRTCAYSRAGIMWSDARTTKFSASQAAREVQAALAAAGERGPYVIVAHSLGGPYAMVFTRMYGPDVAGLVFVDPTHPDQFPRYREAAGRDVMPTAGEARLGAALAWTGLLRKLPPVPNAPEWMRSIEATAAAFLPTSVSALAEETEAIPQTLAEARTLTTLGDRPFIVLTAVPDSLDPQLAAAGITWDQAKRLTTARLELHETESHLSSSGQHRQVKGAGHYIQFDNPMAVISAVRDVVSASRR